MLFGCENLDSDRHEVEDPVAPTGALADRVYLHWGACVL